MLLTGTRWRRHLAMPMSDVTGDQLGRPLRDLRISVTDRCNFRCRYCMPAEIFGPGYTFLPKTEVLRFEEVAGSTRLLRKLVSGSWDEEFVVAEAGQAIPHDPFLPGPP